MNAFSRLSFVAARYYERASVFLLLCAASSRLSLGATTWHVDVNGGGDFKTIQAAIDNAEDGDTIEVAPGLYDKEGLTIRKSLSIRGAGPQYVTIQHPGGGLSIEFVDPAPARSSVDIFGVAVRGGGHGLVIRSGNDVTIRNCVVESAVSSGVHVQRGASAAVSHCTIVANALSGVEAYGGSVSVSDCIFASNGQQTLVGRDGQGGSMVVFVVSVFAPEALGSVTAAFPLVIADPQFVDAPRGNYFLKATSKVKDKARGGSGALDPDGTVADLGAYGGPDSASFWPYPTGGPIVRSLTLDKGAARQGEKIKITAAATTR